MPGAESLSLGVNTISFMWHEPARQTMESLARLGYRYFEILAAPSHLDPALSRDGALAFVRFLRAAGLTVETLNVPSIDLNLASASPEIRNLSVRIYTQLITLASDIGARGVVVVGGRLSPLANPPRHDLESWFGEAFLRLLPAAERAGIRLLLENTPLGIFRHTDCLSAFVDKVGSPTVGVCYDIANAYFVGDDPEEGLRRLAAHLGVVHLSDTTRRVWRHDPVGEGSVDFASVAATLREIQYTGTSMLEIVAENAVERIVDSHRLLAPLGWSAPSG
jgi:L-ribulose-5-phosphate 3-epimerase